MHMRTVIDKEHLMWMYIYTIVSTYVLKLTFGCGPRYVAITGINSICYSYIAI